MGKNLRTSGILFVAEFPQGSRTPITIQLNGELFAGRGRFDSASATTRRKIPNDADWKNIRFAVFDAPQVAGDFLDRLAVLKKTIAHVPHWVILVQQTTIASHAQLNEKLRQVVNAGGEGLMLRKISAPYIPGRHESLLKLKPLEDDETTVIPGHQNGKQSVKVRDAAGHEFRLTCPANLEIGDIVSYQFNGRTKNGIPRHAAFLRIRKGN